MHTTKKEMIEFHLKARGIKDENVLQAMEEVNRTKFVPEEYEDRAYDDGPLPIGRNQTISQPYIVAYMAQALKLKPSHKVMEVGTGCGYNAAVLSRIVNKVYSVEIIEWLAELAQKNLKKANIKNVEAKYGDGYQGWPEAAPFDAIVLTAAAPVLPESLKKQVKIGGRLLAPVGKQDQQLILLNKTAEDQFKKELLLPVRFVPMTGEVEKY